MSEAYIAALQRFADDHFGEGAVEVVPVSEQHSMGNRNWADSEREQEIIAALDAQCEVAFMQVAGQPWPTR